MSDSVPASLIGTGVTLGILHVLTGPDHVSALAALSANVSSLTAFFLGVRWGIGHSLGLILIAVILIGFLSIDDKNGGVGMPHSVTIFLQALVGIIMIALGLYSMWRAHENRRRGAAESAASASAASLAPVVFSGVASPDGLMVTDDAAVQMSYAVDSIRRFDDDFVDPRAATQLEELQPAGIATDEGFKVKVEGTDELKSHNPSILPPIEPTYAATAAEVDGLMKSNVGAHNAAIVDLEGGGIDSETHIDTIQQSSFLGYCCARLSTNTMALITGIVHGVAGPGGVLGVIPAVQLRDWKLAFLYLGCFCISSTFTMAVFAALYGGLTSRMARGDCLRRKFWIEFGSACLSIAVGVIWLILLATGKLDDLFDDHIEPNSTR